MVELKNVSLLRNGTVILNDLSMRVEAGQCCAVIGPNGSGKSTLLAVLAGYAWPTTGTVHVAGFEFGRVDLSAVRRKIGLIEPSRMPRFNERMTVRDMVATGLFGTVALPLSIRPEQQQWQRVHAAIAETGLGGRENDRFAILSTGERMKVLIARAIVAGPSILMLDEPTVGLDMGSRAAFMNSLDRLAGRSDRPTVLIVSHHLDELPRNVDRVLLMKGGSIFDCGPPQHVLTSDKLSDLFNCRVHVFQRDGTFAAVAAKDGDSVAC